MAKLVVKLKNNVSDLEIETSQKSAMRVLNRYLAFMRHGGEAPNRYVVDGEDAGVIALRMEDVQAIFVKKDDD